MQITGKQLVFLIQVLKDSLEVQMGYGWIFKYNHEQRESFYQELIESLFSQNDVEVKEIDLSELKG
ncbi:TPA: hypothetical protein ACPSKZ_000691 [Legionella anisa]|uniref:hypothetical protein n=1 Tax=Legionella anisa TaxID=28082 RepID=UPI0022442F3C|nr:hypothetical protein [Legionella anisa]MCW8425611.1 hypothetical protein [Legionella anisa]MCW8448960.1 hypothetical protein [Legionella anisa]